MPVNLMDLAEAIEKLSEEERDALNILIGNKNRGFWHKCG